MDAAFVLTSDGEEVFHEVLHYRFGWKKGGWAYVESLTNMTHTLEILASQLKESIGSDNIAVTKTVITFSPANMKQNIICSSSRRLSITINQLDPFLLGVTSSLNADFQRLLTDEDAKDFTFKFETNEIKAHKFVLATRSPVFKKLFETDMKEKQSGIIEIEDASFQAFTIFLDFIYGGDYKDDEFVPELLYLADKYDVPELKARAANTMIKKISFENAIDVLILFDRHNVPQLKSQAAKFIGLNWENIFQDEKKKNLETTYPHLADMIQTAIHTSITCCKIASK